MADEVIDAFEKKSRSLWERFEKMMDIPEKIASYKDECAAVLSWLSKDAWLHQDEFDRLALEWRLTPRKVEARPKVVGQLVPPMNGSILLLILQELVRAKIVDHGLITGGKMIYRLAKK